MLIPAAVVVPPVDITALVGIHIVGAVVGDSRPLAGIAALGLCNAGIICRPGVDVVIGPRAAVVRRPVVPMMAAVMISVAVAGSITSAVTVTRIRPVRDRAPKATAPIAAVTTPSNGDSERAIRITEAAAPAIPWIPAYVKAPGRVVRIVVVWTPVRAVVPAGAIYNTAVRDITSCVAGSVANVDHFGCRFVDLDIGNVVVRI